MNVVKKEEFCPNLRRLPFVPLPARLVKHCAQKHRLLLLSARVRLWEMQVVVDLLAFPLHLWISLSPTLSML